MLVPIFAAGVALVAALAGYVMVKFFGVIFLGRPREERLAAAHDAGGLERLGLLWLTAGCVLLGLFPVAVIEVIDPIPFTLVGRGLAQSGRIGNWLLLAPVSAERASYSPLILFAVALAVVLLTFVLVRRFYHGRLRRAAAWDCGFPAQTARMQDYGRRLRAADPPDLRAVLPHAPRPADALRRARPATGSIVEDPLWGWVYLRIAAAIERVSRVRGPPAARPHLDLPALQLHHPGRASLPHAGMNLEGILAQLAAMLARAACWRRCSSAG